MRKISLVVMLSLLGLLAGAPALMAQRMVKLLDVTTTSWTYWTNGTDLGTAWRAPAYNDAAWPSGLGLLGVETTPAAYPYPFQTPFAAYNNNIITYYFRAHFNLSAADNKFPMSLIATNLTDDGCIIYLNNNEAGLVRVATGALYNTVATGGPAAEGQYEVVPLRTNGLVTGDNVVAVEVHQTGTGSSDLVHGMSLWAIVPTAVSITTQPTNQTAFQSQSATLSVGISGGPAVYQWQTTNNQGAWVNISLATNNIYSPPTITIGSFNYRVVVSNGVNSVISSVATVTVIDDRVGPVPLSAVVLEDPTVTNRIQIVWNESLLSSTVASTPLNSTMLTNGTFRIVMLASNNAVISLTNSALLAGLTTNILTVYSTNWHYRSNYYICFNRVRDFKGNVVAPCTIIPITWPISTNILNPLTTSQTWYYHVSWFAERYPDMMTANGPDIYTNNWAGLTYTDHLQPLTYWGSTINPRMTFELSTTAICYTNAPREGIGFQLQPSLFRTTFMWPTNESVGTNVDLTFDYGGDDAVAIFLNGSFLFSDTNFPAGTITAATRSSSVSEGACKTRVVPAVALRRGSNVLAAAVAQFNTEGDSGFVCKLDARSFQTSPLPPALSNTLFTNLLRMTNITRQGNNIVSVFWPSNCYGCALVYRTNVNSGPWVQEQPNMANPFFLTNPAPGSHKFYRLERLQ